MFGVWCVRVVGFRVLAQFGPEQYADALLDGELGRGWGCGGGEADVLKYRLVVVAVVEIGRAHV